jgi:Tetratricopeptide repeat.
MINLTRLLRIVMLLTPLLMANAVQADSKAHIYYDRGVALAAQGKFSDAKETFEQALKTDPQNYQVLRCLSVLRDLDRRRIKEQTAVHLFQAFSAFNRYRADTAILNLNQAAELDPDYPLIFAHRADAFLDQGRSREALADYDKALEMDPEYAAGYVNRGNYYSRQGQFDRAIVDYSRAIQIEPQNVLAYYSRGNAYGGQGRLDAAVADYNKILEINLQYPHAYVRKGLALEKLGRLQEALAAYKAYLQNLNLQDQDPQQVKWVEDKIKSFDKNLLLNGKRTK